MLLYKSVVSCTLRAFLYKGCEVIEEVDMKRIIYISNKM